MKMDIGEILFNAALQAKNEGNNEYVVEYLTQAINEGYTKATSYLAAHYIFTLGGNENIALGIQTLTDGAKQSDAKCMFYLARCYETGIGGNQDMPLALDYYKKCLTISPSNLDEKEKQQAGKAVLDLSTPDHRQENRLINNEGGTKANKTSPKVPERLMILSALGATAEPVKNSIDALNPKDTTTPAETAASHYYESFNISKDAAPLQQVNPNLKDRINQLPKNEMVENNIKKARNFYNALPEVAKDPKLQCKSVWKSYQFPFFKSSWRSR